MKLSADLHIPYPPSANRLWRRAGHVIHKSAEYTAWLSDAGLYVKSQRQPGIVGKYKLIVTAARPDRRRRDLDNLLKPLSDLLMHTGIVGDDCDCDMIVARWVTDGDGIAVRVEPVGSEE